MVSQTAARKIALSLPMAEESSHHGTPDFRVKGKIFATFYTLDTMVLKLPMEEHTALIDTQPEVFSSNWAGGGKFGWTRVELSAMNKKGLEPLVVMAWRTVATKTLQKEFDEKE